MQGTIFKRKHFKPPVKKFQSSKVINMAKNLIDNRKTRQKVVSRKAKKLKSKQEKVEYKNLLPQEDEQKQLNHTVSLPILDKQKPNFSENRKNLPENRILARIGFNRSNTNAITEFLKDNPVENPVEVQPVPFTPAKSTKSMKSAS